MELIKGSNLLVRFLLELAMLAAIGYWGFQSNAGWFMKAVLGIGLPLLIAVVWGAFLSPRAAYPLPGISHLALELILLGSGAVALFFSGRTNLAVVYAAMLVVNKLLMVAWKQ